LIDSIDYTLPGTEECNDSNELQLSQCGVEVIASLLLRYRDGSYEGDLSFRVPAMSYITKVYSYSQHFGASNEVSSDDMPAKNETMLQEYEFHTMVTAIYNDACLSEDDNIAKSACLRMTILRRGDLNPFRASSCRLKWNRFQLGNG